MFQVQSVLGLPVLRKNGSKAGSVKDIWFDEAWCAAGIVLTGRAWKRRAFKGIRWTDIAVIGEDALILRGGGTAETLEQSLLQRAFLDGKVSLKDMPVYSESGLELGRISDVYFKESEGTPLLGFELTDGFLSDVLEGRRRLLLPDGPEQITLGGDAILVPASFERVLT